LNRITPRLGGEAVSRWRFAGFGGFTDTLPKETTILNFRHLLEKHELTAVLLEAINAHLKAQGLLVSKGTMVDATLIHAPSSTKNRDRHVILRCTRGRRESNGTLA
jgi:IS5 family transposase